jgi:mannose-1-phosphate guanylyltransferase
VKTFTEKPNLELAEVFCESGEFVWNSGIFIWNAKSIMSAFSTYLPEVVNRFNDGLAYFNTPEEKKFIDENYPFCQNISIDYGIMEKAENVYVIVTDFGWSDLGTWGSLHEVSAHDGSNNANINCNTIYIESYDNIIAMNNKEKLVVVQGLEDYIIAESDNALLICKKSEEQRIKNFVTDVKFRFGDKYI